MAYLLLVRRHGWGSLCTVFGRTYSKANSNLKAWSTILYCVGLSHLRLVHSVRQPYCRISAWSAELCDTPPPALPWVQFICNIYTYISCSGYLSTHLETLAERKSEWWVLLLFHSAIWQCSAHIPIIPSTYKRETTRIQWIQTWKMLSIRHECTWHGIPELTSGKQYIPTTAHDLDLPFRADRLLIWVIELMLQGESRINWII